MNTKQLASLNNLLALLTTVRGFDKDGLQHTEATQTNGQVQVLIVPASGEEFPVISIGKQGGYGMPDIKSYPENGKASSYQYPGNTALDAALFGDKHLARQRAGRKVAVVAVAPTVPADEKKEDTGAAPNANEVPVEQPAEAGKVDEEVALQAEEDATVDQDEVILSDVAGQ